MTDPAQSCSGWEGAPHASSARQGSRAEQGLCLSRRQALQGVNMDVDMHLEKLLCV